MIKAIVILVGAMCVGMGINLIIIGVPLVFSWLAEDGPIVVKLRVLSLIAPVFGVALLLVGSWMGRLHPV